MPADLNKRWFSGYLLILARSRQLMESFFGQVLPGEREVESKDENVAVLPSDFLHHLRPAAYPASY